MMQVADKIKETLRVKQKCSSWWKWNYVGFHKTSFHYNITCDTNKQTESSWLPVSESQTFVEQRALQMFSWLIVTKKPSLNTLCFIYFNSYQFHSVFPKPANHQTNMWLTITCVFVICSMGWEAAEAPRLPSHHSLIRGCTGPPQLTMMTTSLPQVHFLSDCGITWWFEPSPAILMQQ